MTQAASGIADAVDWRLYFVTDTEMSGGPDRVPWTVEQAILGGTGVVQIRDKDLSNEEFLALSRACVEAAERAFDQSGQRAALIVNDRLDVAEELGLHFHQGQSDGDVQETRRRLGSELLIGLSISDLEQLETELANQTADVLGLSPIWSTPTKTDTDPALGLDGAAQIIRMTAGRARTVGIGGINVGNARSVIDIGVDGFCVVSAIATAKNPRDTAAQLLSLW